MLVRVVIDTNNSVLQCDFLGGPDLDYGPNDATPDLPEEEMTVATAEFIKKLCDETATEQQRHLLESKTRGQHENRLWREARRNYLTSSNFGALIKRKKQTPCHNLVKRLLYSKELKTAAITYGRIHEKVAIERQCAMKNVSVEDCGLFVDAECAYLAASPDGYV